MKKFGVDGIINPIFFVSFHQFLPSVYILICVVQCLLQAKMTDSISLDCFKPIMMHQIVPQPDLRPKSEATFAS